MPPTPPTPASRLLARSLQLSGRLLARRRAPRAQLATRVAERRRPHIARIARRLSRAPDPAQTAFAPDGMSDFASRWIFGDGRAEGIPLGDSEARAALARASGPPSFQDDEPNEGLTWPAPSPPSPASVARTPVEEFGARRAQAFRLSSTPAARGPAPGLAPDPGPTSAAAPAASESSPPTRADMPAQPPVTPSLARRARSAGDETTSETAAAPGPLSTEATSAGPEGELPPSADSTPTAPPAAQPPAFVQAPVRAVLSRSPTAPAPPPARQGAAPVRLVAAPARPAAAPPAPAPPSAPATARLGLLRRALNTAAAALTRRRGPVRTAPGAPAAGGEPETAGATIAVAAPGARSAAPGEAPAPGTAVSASVALARAAAPPEPPQPAEDSGPDGQAEAESDPDRDEPAQWASHEGEAPTATPARGEGAPLGAVSLNRAPVEAPSAARPGLPASGARSVPGEVPTQAERGPSATTEPTASPASPPSAEPSARVIPTLARREAPAQGPSASRSHTAAVTGESPGEPAQMLIPGATPAAEPAPAPSLEAAPAPALEAAPALSPAATPARAADGAPAASRVVPAPQQGLRADAQAPSITAHTPTGEPSVLRAPARPHPPAAGRPLLRAERRSRTAPRAPSISGIPGMPGATGTSGTQLARALGLPVTPEADGNVSIALDGAASASSSPPLLARAPMGDDGGSAPSPSAPPTPAPAAPAAPAGAAHPAGPGAPTIDEIYEGVVERLRHDLLIERERMGDLIGGLP